MSEKKDYKASYGLLRIIACMTVIVHHVLSAVYGDLTKTQLPLLVDNLLMCNNGLFFMMSGKFALENYKGDIAAYYKKKVTTIVIPVFLLSVFYYIWYNGTGVADFFRAFMANEIVEYFWFVTTLLGFYLAVPFLSVMLRKMTEREKDVFLLLLFTVVGLNNLGEITGFDLRVEGYPFATYILFCLLGFFADNSSMKKHVKAYLILGVISAAVSCWECLRQMNPSIYGVCLTRIFMCIAIFYAVSVHLARFSKICQRPIVFLAKYTFYIYLFHGFAQEIVLSWTIGIWNGKNYAFYCIICSFLVLALSLVLSIIFQSILSFLGRLLYNCTWIKNE